MLAELSVEKAFEYCIANGNTFSKGDIHLAASQLAMPDVGVAALDKALDAAYQNPEKYGAEVKKTYPNGNILFAPSGQHKADKALGTTLGAWASSPGGGLSNTQVVKAMAGQGLTAHDFYAVAALADNKNLGFCPDAINDPRTLRLLADAYEANGKKVYAVGRDAGAAMGRQTYSPHGLAEAVTRTGHLASLWRGLRASGTLNDRLDIATAIRNHGHLKIEPGALVVASLEDVRDAKAVSRVANAVARQGGRLVLTGPGAEQLERLTPQYLQTIQVTMGS